KKIYDFIYFKTHHKETAQDLTSIVFVKAMQKINTFDNKSNFSAWLYRIARNTVIDHFRVLKKDKNIDDIWDLADNSDIAQDIDIKNKLAEVKKYLKNLKSDQRDIVIMRLWQNMSYAEIAQTLGKSEDSCKMSFSRTIKNLRGEFILAMLVLFITR
ncbi:RNA polymerase subunit sigma-24, partial [Candidatus Falkowbacteria bacterium CG10_big_fil_rev_8_21_14_0_10_37_6]